MEFLVQITVRLPSDMSDEERRVLLHEEWIKGRELRSQGVIVRIWRVPGALRNVGIWKAADATELHAKISSLPAFKYLNADVTALAAHPVEADAD